MSDSRRSDPRVTIRGDDRALARDTATPPSPVPLSWTLYAYSNEILRRDSKASPRSFALVHSFNASTQCHILPLCRASSTASSATSSATSSAASSAAVPIIDIAKLASGFPEERAHLAQAFDEALSTSGFCQLVGYESLLPEADISALRTASAAFFAAPSQAKERSYVDGVVGYLGVGAENVAASAGTPSAQPDPVESLNLPAYQEEGKPWRSAAAEAECPWRDAAYLPSDAVAPGFRQAATRYFKGATALMLRLMTLSELALDLPEGYFTPPFSHPGTLLRAAYYPPRKEAETQAAEAKAVGMATEPQLRYGAHTDYDGFTILQRAAGDTALEILSASGQWLTVEALPNTLTINIGDLLARWTNDRWRATTHRVVAVAAPAACVSATTGPKSSCNATGRLSIVYFTGPAPQTTVACLPCSKCQQGAPKYKPITAEQHVTEKMLAATAHATP